MAFALKLKKVPKADIDRKVGEAADILDLTEHLARKPANLSGGQRQRVAMGRAIVRDPKVFLMDEPLSNLDAKLRVQMRAQVARIQRRFNTTTVYVTHDQTEAMTLGDRVAVMLSGLLQQVGSPMELYNNPSNLFVAGFIGSPGMNFMPATLTNGSVNLPMGEVALPQEVRERLGRQPDGRRVIAGIRPEDFEDATKVDRESPRARRHVQGQARPGRGNGGRVLRPLRDPGQDGAVRGAAGAARRRRRRVGADRQRRKRAGGEAQPREPGAIGRRSGAVARRDRRCTSSTSSRASADPGQ